MVTAMRNHLAPDLGRNARRLADERIRVLDLHQFTADRVGLATSAGGIYSLRY